jgi:hypothetical protein
MIFIHSNNVDSPQMHANIEKFRICFPITFLVDLQVENKGFVFQFQRQGLATT